MLTGRRAVLAVFLGAILLACGCGGGAAADGDEADGDAEADREPAAEIEPEEEPADDDPAEFEPEAADAAEADERSDTSEIPEGSDLPEEAEPDPENGDQPLPLELLAVVPASGGASDPTPVVLYGAGFGSEMQVRVGSMAASEVAVRSSGEAAALLPPVPLTERGPKDLSVVLDGREAVLRRGFEYLFDHDPIVFVHGYVVGDRTWDALIARFRTLGYPDSHLQAIHFSNSIQSNIENARDELGPFVDRVLTATGAERVDIVCHSMGGISSRLWIGRYGGADKVRDFVSMSGTHHGSDMGWFTQWLGEAGEEMYPAYAEQADSVNEVQWLLNGDPDAADVDETPDGVEEGGGIRYRSIWSTGDGFILPAHSQCLNQASRGDCSDPVNVRVEGIFHMDMLTSQPVFELAAGFVMAHRPGLP